MKVKSLYIDRMRASITQIQTYLQDISMGEFENNTLVHDAVLMQFQHLGETANKLKQSFPEETRIPFSEIISFRNLIAHEYLGIEAARVYEIAIEELPKLDILLAHIEDESEVSF